MMETTITVQQEVATDHQPNEEATTVSVKTEKRWKNISFDINYFRSTLGKLKLVQLVRKTIAKLSKVDLSELGIYLGATSVVLP